MEIPSDKETFSEDEVQSWFEDEEEEEGTSDTHSPQDPAEKYARSQLRVVRETKDYQLDYLHHALRPGQETIDTSPQYQRRIRWPRKKRSLLIESFLLNIPVPPVFLFEHDYNEYEVIDGRQRLDSIRAFVTNELALSGLEYWHELNGKRFSDLPQVLRKGLLRRSLSAVVLLAESASLGDNELDVRRVLFDRLNTGGEKLNPQELRNALYPGRFNSLLIRLARSHPFTEIWNIPPYVKGEETEPPEKLTKNTLFKTMADAELVLRYFAVRDAVQNDKKGSLRTIMDRYMRASSTAAELDISEYENEFINLLKRLFALFDGEPFRLPNSARPSRPLYDALMIALSRNSEQDVEHDKNAIHDRLRTYLEDDEAYGVLVGRGNTIEAIKARVSLAERILLGSGA